MAAPPRHTDARDTIVVALLACLAAAPAAWPGAEYYMDNGPHTLEVALLAREILPGEHWYMGWTDGANAGMALGQLNAPLAWVPVALLARLGLPIPGLLGAAALLSNVVFALGALRLGRVLFADRRAALLGAVIAAASPMDLWGVGGAMGGMWPFRLANGIVLLGLAVAPARRRAATVGLWLSLVLLLHSFSGQEAFALAGVGVLYALARRRVGEALQLVGGIAPALLVTSAFWVPLLDPALRGFGEVWRTTPRELAALLFLPVDVFDLRGAHVLTLIGGPVGWTWAAVTLGGAAAALRLASWAAPARVRRLGLLALSLAVAVALAHLTGSGLLGPNPWRQLAQWHAALALLAGAGLVAALRRAGIASACWIIATALAALSARVGAHEVPLRVAGDTATTMAALEATWADLAVLPELGRVYQVDSFQAARGPAAMRGSHPGGAPAARHDIDLVGSWYTMTPSTSVVLASAEGAGLLGTPRQSIDDLAAWLEFRLSAYGVDAVVVNDAELDIALHDSDAFALVTRHGPFAAYRRTTPPLPVLGVKPPARVDELMESRGHVEADVKGEGEGDGPIPFRLRQSFHPWWRATLDGQPVALREDPDTGLIEGELPAAGHLVLQWEDHGRPLRPLSALGLLLLAAAGMISARRKAAPTD